MNGCERGRNAIFWKELDSFQKPWGGGRCVGGGGRGGTPPVKMELVNIVVSQKLQMNTYLMDPGLPTRTQ